jgi:hypothetical protein
MSEVLPRARDARPYTYQARRNRHPLLEECRGEESISYALVGGSADVLKSYSDLTRDLTSSIILPFIIRLVPVS